MKKEQAFISPPSDLQSSPCQVLSSLSSTQNRPVGILSPRYSSPRCISPRCISPKGVRNSRLSPVHSRILSPTSRNSRTAVSPKRTSTQHKPVSAYNKIRSSRAIKNTLLPSFVRIYDSEMNKFMNSFYLSKTKTADTTVNDSKLIRSRKNSPVNEHLSGYYKNLAEINKSVFDNNKDPDEILAVIGKIQLTRALIFNLKPGRTLSDLLIDACLKCVKKKNTKLFKKGKVKDKVYILSTKFCKNLFSPSTSQPIRIKKSLLEYTYLLFPIYVGYWTLLVVNTKAKNAKYFDPIGIEKNDSFICTQLFSLIKKELKTHENKEIENTRWQRLEYERINELEAFDHIDSSVYIVRQASKVSINKNIQVRPEILPEYRNKLLLQIFKYSQNFN